MTPLLLLGLGCAAHTPTDGVAGGGSPPERAFQILAFNDVYRIEGIPEAQAGGLARLRTLRASLEAQGGEVLVLGAGDFLSPSLLSNLYKGEQMVDVLNTLDAAPGVFDPRLILGFGNHELDSRSCAGAAALTQRLAESEFNWLNTNLSFGPCEAVPALVGSNLLPRQLLRVGGVEVGVFALLMPLDGAVSWATVSDPVAAARGAITALRAEGAEVVIALTHQSMADDLALLEALGEDRPELIVGGHEHAAQSAEVQGVPVVKADSDARSAVVWTVALDRRGAPQVGWSLRALDGNVAPDPAVQEQVDGWMTRHQEEFCAANTLVPGCLDIPLGHTAVELEGEETAIRTRETTLGNWVADEMRQAFIDDDAQIALINGGALRLNQDLPAGAVLTRRHFETLLPFGSELVLLEVDGATLQAAIERSVRDWTGQGHFLQVSGLRFSFDPSTGEVRGLGLLSAAAADPLLPDQVYRVVTLEYLAQGNDGYTMFNPGQIVAEGEELKALLMSGVQKAEPQGLSPRLEGRICNTRADRCP